MTTDGNKMQPILGINVPVVGVSGPVDSGKTLFVSGLAPADQLMIDAEISSETYSIPFKRRINLYTELAADNPNGWKPIDAFKWFLKLIKSIKPGEYRVISVDPISDIEQGLADYVASNFAEYGFSSAEKFQSTGGIFWSYVKAFWKQTLGELATKCEIFAFTTHLKGVWQHGKPTGRKVPQGSDVLEKLASLYLLMERKANQDGKLPKVPSATVAKSRLAHTSIDPATGDLVSVSILPAHLPEATPAAIREYVSKPADLKKPKKGETIERELLSDDEKLLIQREIAENQLAAEQAKAQQAEIMVSAAAQQRAEMIAAGQIGTAQPTGTTTSEQPQEAESSTEAAAATEAGPGIGQAEQPASAAAAMDATKGSSEAAQATEGKTQEASAVADAAAPFEGVVELPVLLEDQRRALGINDETWLKILGGRGVSSAAALKPADAVEIAGKLWTKLTIIDVESELKLSMIARLKALGIDTEEAAGN